MSDLHTLPNHGLGWLDASGEHAGVVLSTRIRLARNLQGHAFGPRARGQTTARRSSSRLAERWPRLNSSPDPHCSNFRTSIKEAVGCFLSGDSLRGSCLAT